jgi:hypothetical protein
LCLCVGGVNAGYKVYAICCGESSYTFVILPMTWTSRDERTPEFLLHHPGAGGNVELVKVMTEFLADRKHHILVADNWFTCLPVVDYCTSVGMGFVGAMKHFRGAKAAMLWPVSGLLHALLCQPIPHSVDSLPWACCLCLLSRRVAVAGSPAVRTCCSTLSPSAASSSGWTQRQWLLWCPTAWQSACVEAQHACARLRPRRRQRPQTESGRRGYGQTICPCAMSSRVVWASARGVRRRVGTSLWSSRALCLRGSTKRSSVESTVLMRWVRPAARGGH